jgi:C1A family cysteine protease
MLSLGAPAAVAYSGAINLSGDWEAFKTKFGKTYESKTEEYKRFDIFAANMKQAETENAALGAIHELHKTQGVTKFMDLTAEEFKAQFLTRKTGSKFADMNGVLPEFNGECTACKRFPEHAELLKDPPASFDWTTKGAVTKVKDQGQCGSCWAFGTTGDIEGTWFLAGNDLTSLSEQELVSCDKGSDEGCNGGLQEDAFVYVEKNGLTSEANYPYTSGGGRDGVCKKAKESPVAAKITSWNQVSKKAAQEDQIKTALIAQGPITIGINASPMQRYNRGIDNPRLCLKSSLDHAVLVVGYGTEGGVDYWKIKNSWASDWGEQGYYRIVRGEDKCGLAQDAVHSVV